MARAYRLEPRPVVLGVAAWLALAGWRLVLPGIAFAIAHGQGGEPPFEMSPSASALASAIGYLAFAVPGYVAARAAAHKPLLHALAIGAVVAALSFLAGGLAGRLWGEPGPLDAAEALIDAALALVAAQVGGALAVWHLRSRGAARWGARILSLRASVVLLALAAVPYALVVAALAL